MEKYRIIYDYPNNRYAYYGEIMPWYHGVFVSTAMSHSSTGTKYTCFNMQGDSLYTTSIGVWDRCSPINYEEYIMFSLSWDWR